MLNILIINSQQTYQLQMSKGLYTCTFEKFKSLKDWLIQQFIVSKKIL